MCRFRRLRHHDGYPTVMNGAMVVVSVNSVLLLLIRLLSLLLLHFVVALVFFLQYMRATTMTARTITMTATFHLAHPCGSRALASTTTPDEQRR